MGSDVQDGSWAPDVRIVLWINGALHLRTFKLMQIVQDNLRRWIQVEDPADVSHYSWNSSGRALICQLAALLMVCLIPGGAEKREGRERWKKRCAIMRVCGCKNCCSLFHGWCNCLIDPTENEKIPWSW
jgi:hypothetical protein